MLCAVESASRSVFSGFHEEQAEATRAEDLMRRLARLPSDLHGAEALLDALLAIERSFGRERPAPNAARTLDLDLLLYGDRIVVEPGLEVPHPRFRERFFVLGPLAEVGADMTDPVSGQTVAQLLRALLRDEAR